MFFVNVLHRKLHFRHVHSHSCSRRCLKYVSFCTLDIALFVNNQMIKSKLNFDVGLVLESFFKNISNEEKPNPHLRACVCEVRR